MNLETIVKLVEPVVRKAGAFIQQEAQKTANIVIEEKEKNSLVSYVDKTAEQILVEGLLQIIPAAGLITEEETEDVQGCEWEWIIDPLDGTTNFLHNIPAYSVSVGLRHNEEIVAGWVYELNMDELFYAWKNGGAWCNGKPISVSKRQPMANTLLATGFPYNDYSNVPGYLGTLESLMHGSRGLRRLGSAAVDLAYTACGRFDGFWEYSLSPWDVAGGIIIVQEAGGRVTDFSGGNNYLFGREMIATNGLIHDELLAVIKSNFKK